MCRFVVTLLLLASVLGSSLAWAWDRHGPATGEAGEAVWLAPDSDEPGAAADRCHFCSCGSGHVMALAAESGMGPVSPAGAGLPGDGLTLPSSGSSPPTKPPRA